MNKSEIKNVTLEERLMTIAFDIQLTIIVLGFITNLLCIIVFSLICKTFRNNGQMYKYLLMKSICDLIYFTIYILNESAGIAPDEIHYILFFQIIDKYFSHFMVSLLEAYSIYFEILATIDCYVSIENKHKSLLTKKAFYISTLMNLTIFPFIYCAKLLVYSIKPKGEFYKMVKTPLYYSKFYEAFTILYLIIRDFLGSILMIYFNILIVYKLKKMTKLKELMGHNKARLRALEAQKKKVTMIQVSCINYILFHIPSVTHHIYGKYHVSYSFWLVFGSFKSVFFNFSYATPFIIYFLFNTVFQQYFLRLIRLKQSGHSYHQNQ
jgi:hypothetical protein